MKDEQLGEKLKEYYNNGPSNNKVTNIHLFSIKYSKELANADKALVAIIGTNKKSYASEISKGIKIAPYLDIKILKNTAQSQYFLISKFAI